MDQDYRVVTEVNPDGTVTFTGHDEAGNVAELFTLTPRNADRLREDLTYALADYSNRKR
jgi:YD repeat-containing protein